MLPLQWHIQAQLVKAYTPQRMSQIALLASTQCLGPATHACTSAGTMEDWRPDISGVEEACIGNRLPDWPKERYWDVRCPSVREALTKVSHEETAMSRGHTLRCLACSAATEHAGHHTKEFPVPTDRARLYHMCVPLTLHIRTVQGHISQKWGRHIPGQLYGSAAFITCNKVAPPACAGCCSGSSSATTRASLALTQVRRTGWAQMLGIVL